MDQLVFPCLVQDEVRSSLVPGSFVFGIPFFSLSSPYFPEDLFVGLRGRGFGGLALQFSFGEYVAPAPRTLLSF